MTSSDQTSTGDVSGFIGKWVLDAATTTIVFHTKALWILNVKGTLKALSGEGTVDPDGTVAGRIVLDTTSIDTRNNKRDEHLRTGDFFEAVKYPTITFVTTAGSVNGSGRLELVGTLSVRDQTQPLTLVADASGDGRTAVVSGEVDIDRSVWGMTWAKMGAGLKNRVVIQAIFNKI